MRKVITIAREFGAGGGEIGRKVAKELGIQFYDKDIILRTALANPKLDPEDVRRWDERVPSSFGFAQSLFDFYNKPLDERLWQAQRDAIRVPRNQAASSSCRQLPVRLALNAHRSTLLSVFYFVCYYNTVFFSCKEEYFRIL